MFELDKYNRQLQKTPPAEPRETYSPAEDVAGMSLLLWGEHCIECAAPDCYSTCDLYQPRVDLNCRRFAFGAFKNTAFRSLRGYGVEIVFKKWGKLQASANTAIFPVSTVTRWERLVESVAPVGNLVGRMAYRGTGSYTWAQLTAKAIGRLTRRLHERGKSQRQPDAFLLEVYNPCPTEGALQIIFDVHLDDPQQKACHAVEPVVRSLRLPPGYSRHEFDAAMFQSILDRGLPMKIIMAPEGDSNLRIVFLTADFVVFTRPRQAREKVKQMKCVVWDLDNTLWTGTIAEGDLVELREGVREVLQRLDERGILLSIASKNDSESTWRIIENFGLNEYFLSPQIGWGPKSESIKRIAEDLNLGLDAFAFIDDNAFELDEVKRTLPQVNCISADGIPALLDDPRFRGAMTQESRHRRMYYRNEMLRKKDRSQFNSDDYWTFLASCQMELELSPYGGEDEERVAELVQRTNQLNFSGHKYSRSELREVLKDPSLRKFVIRCSDRYGSYGTVGFCLIHTDNGLIRVLDMMLSCRVQGRFVEHALFSHVSHECAGQPAKAIWVNFNPTDRNKPAQNVLNSMGFRSCRAGIDEVGTGMILDLSNPLKCDFIKITCSFPTHSKQEVADAHCISR